MTEACADAAPLVPPACAQCGGEGALLVPRDGRAVASACACTKTCPACEGSGRLFQVDEKGYSKLTGCTCGADPRRLALLSSLHLPLAFCDRTLEGYRPYTATQARALARARRFVDEFVPGAFGARALLFSGPPGTGKTHLLCAMLRSLALKKGVRGRYDEFFLLLSDIRDGFSSGTSARQWLAPLREVDVLAIDELGKGGRNREFEQGILDEIISVRYNAGKPTLVATNYPPLGANWKFGAEGEVAESLEQRVGARIYSRLHELCDFVEVMGTDFRKDQHAAREIRSGLSVPPPPTGGAANSTPPPPLGRRPLP